MYWNRNIGGKQGKKIFAKQTNSGETKDWSNNLHLNICSTQM